MTLSADATELVPNYWLRTLPTSRHLSPVALEHAIIEAGLEASILDEPGVMLPLHQEIAVLESLARQHDDPVFALRLGLSSDANTGSVLSYMLFASPNLQAALTSICEFARVTRPRSRVELVNSPRGAEFRIAHPELKVQQAFSYREFVIGSILNSWCAATQSSVRPECVYIASHVGRRAHQIASVLGCPVEDAQGYSGIVLGAAALDLPIQSSDERLLQHLTAYGQMLLKQMRPEPTSTRERVFRYLLREVPIGVPRVSDAAQALALSERTLSRKLAQEDTSYRQLVDETRATMAKALLDDPSVSVTEISYLLGFADPASFSHAYRRWTGSAPNSARRLRRESA